MDQQNAKRRRASNRVRVNITTREIATNVMQRKRVCTSRGWQSGVQPAEAIRSRLVMQLVAPSRGAVLWRISALQFKAKALSLARCV